MGIEPVPLAFQIPERENATMVRSVQSSRENLACVSLLLRADPKINRGAHRDRPIGPGVGS